jgi:hypothetical protein
VGQSLPDSGSLSGRDREVYAAFFEHVSQRINLKLLRVGLEGKPVEIALPSVQETIGLNDREAALLNDVSGDYHSSAASILEAARPFVLDARIQQIQAGKVSETLRKTLQEFEERLANTILAHIQRLKDALGPERFQLVDAFAHGPESSNWTGLLLLLPVPRTSVPNVPK